jgi:hypothetical protein
MSMISSFFPPVLPERAAKVITFFYSAKEFIISFKEK